MTSIIVSLIEANEKLRILLIFQSLSCYNGSLAVAQTRMTIFNLLVNEMTFIMGSLSLQASLSGLLISEENVQDDTAGSSCSNAYRSGIYE